MAPSAAVGMRRVLAEPQPPPSSKGKGRRADDSKEGEYIDFEEVKD